MAKLNSIIVIADNDEEYAASLERGLRICGYKDTVVVSDESKVVSTVVRHGAKLLLLDLQWPVAGGNERLHSSGGVEIMEQVRQLPDNQRPKIVCISAGLLERGDEQTFKQQPGGYWLVDKKCATSELVRFLQANDLA